MMYSNTHFFHGSWNLTADISERAVNNDKEVHFVIPFHFFLPQRANVTLNPKLNVLKEIRQFPRSCL